MVAGRVGEHGALDGPAHPVDVDDIGRGRRGDRDAAVGNMVDEPLLPEHPERLARRVPGDVELLRQRRLGQPGAGTELTGDEAIGEPIDQGGFVIHISILVTAREARWTGRQFALMCRPPPLTIL